MSAHEPVDDYIFAHFNEHKPFELYYVLTECLRESTPVEAIDDYVFNHFNHAYPSEMLDVLLSYGRSKDGNS